MQPTQYQALAAKLCTCRILEPYQDVLLSLPTLDMDQRAAVARLCRAQCYPPRSSRLARMSKSLPIQYQMRILPLCQTPLLAGLLLSLVLMAPMSDLEVSRIYSESLVKEMVVMESVKRVCTLDFRVFFGFENHRLHDSFASNPTMARNIRRSIDDWIRSLESRVLYPKISSKTISKVTSSNLFGAFPDYQPLDEIGVTAMDLERVYHDHGYLVDGPCEMRQKWYSSNLKPRTYYAQGGTAFHSSKHLAEAFTDLCDTLPCTNRRIRVDPGRIVIRDPTSDVIYYDLHSFTSNLHVQSHFMMQLALYCKGRFVTILDSYHGVMTADLGELIHTYTMRNLNYPEYTLPSKYNDPTEVHYHGIAGFLGVYGNIATATFIHGAVMLMLHDYSDENNVAGDDGLDVTNDVDRSLTMVRTMGEVADEKTFRSSEGCCIHLKRPIVRVGNTLLHGQLLTWPSLECGQTQTDNRYPYMSNMSKDERVSAIASSVTAFLRSLESTPLNDDEVEMVHGYLERVYGEYGLPREGCVPQATPSSRGFVPAYEKRYIGRDPISNTIQRLYQNIARVPMRERKPMEWEMLSGPVFTCNQTKLLRHLEVLGYVEQEKLDVYVYGEEGLSRLLKEYTKPDPKVYQYRVVRQLPGWVSDLMSLNS